MPGLWTKDHAAKAVMPSDVRPLAPAKQSPAEGVTRRLPRHVAIILDGNGRWATQQGLPRPAGHVKGVEAVREVAAASLEKGIEVLSLFAFSVLNWRRPEQEVQGLMRIFRHYLQAEAPRLAREGIQLRLIGEEEGLPPEVRQALTEAQAASPAAPRLVLNLAVNYGGREELIQVARGLAKRVSNGQIEAEHIDELQVESQLYTSDLPPVDLLIRTAGERRLSNFMLWQSAYAELLFLDVLWPDFNRTHFEEALRTYASRKRTFGGLIEKGTPEGTAAVR